MKKDLETLRTGLSTGNRIKLCCTIFVDLGLFCLHGIEKKVLVIALSVLFVLC